MLPNMVQSRWIGVGILVAMMAVLGGCGEDETEPNGSGGAGGEGASAGTGAVGGVPLLGDDCDPIVPSHCGYPFPSNVYLEEDDTTDTGQRVAFGLTTLPKADIADQHTPPSAVSESDGFSAGATLLTHLPGATVTGLATPWSIERSLVATSPTVLIDAETGEWIPHWSELDRTDFQDDERRAFMIRPAVRLKDATRYLVAIRGVVDADGKPLEPSPAFAALRDDESFDHPSVGLRRALYDDIFQSPRRPWGGAWRPAARLGFHNGQSAQ